MSARACASSISLLTSNRKAQTNSPTSSNRVTSMIPTSEMRISGITTSVLQGVSGRLASLLSDQSEGNVEQHAGANRVPLNNRRVFLQCLFGFTPLEHSVGFVQPAKRAATNRIAVDTKQLHDGKRNTENERQIAEQH